MATPIPENHATFVANEIVESTGATMLRAPERPIRGVSTDSRACRAETLFVALRGEHHDGHAHLAQAVEQGASAVLVERELDVPPSIGVFRVEDTLRALGALAGFHRRRFATLPLVAITGSVGKTTTKELTVAALRGVGRSTAHTIGNLNNRIGVPMTLFTLGPDHDAAVIEIGMSVPGEIAELTAICLPSVGVVTSVAEVHTEGVGGIEGVAQEKGALLAGLDADATAVWCSDEPLLATHAERSGAARKIAYGRAEDAHVRLVRWELDGHAGMRAAYAMPDRSELLEVRLRLIGGAAALNTAGALAVACALIPDRIEEAASALAEVAPHAHRMAPIELASGLLVIDDSYNASPRSTVAALDTAAALAGARGGGLVAVLGDMLELGTHAERLHEEVGRAAIRVGARAFIACGELMTHAGKAALRAAMERAAPPRPKVVLLRKVEDAAECVRELAADRDVVLVKGSRGMRMERVVDALAEAAS